MTDHYEKTRKARCWLGVERNRHPAGRAFNTLFGLCQVADGFIRIVSLGYLHTRLTSTVARKATVEAHLPPESRNGEGERQ